MESIKISGSLKSCEYEYQIDAVGCFDGENISYKDNNIYVSINIKSNIMKRIGNDYEVIFKFKKDKKTTNTLSLKDLKQTIHMPLNTLDILAQDGHYYVKYELNDDELFIFEIFYEYL